MPSPTQVLAEEKKGKRSAHRAKEKREFSSSSSFLLSSLLFNIDFINNQIAYILIPAAPSPHSKRQQAFLAPGS
jgi:hypothetical protein